MSAAAKNSAAYWRIAGMSYLKYANACGEVVRQSLKEPFLTQVRTIDRRARETSTDDARRAIQQAKARETVYYKMTKYAEGKAGQAGA